MTHWIVNGGRGAVALGAAVIGGAAAAPPYVPVSLPPGGPPAKRSVRAT